MGILHHTDYFVLNNKEKYFSIYLGACRLSLSEVMNPTHILPLLMPEERAILDTFVFKRRRLSYLLGRLSAKSAIAAMTRTSDWSRIGIGNGIFFQPIVKGDFHSNIQVGISHCDELGVAIAYPEEIILGIDLERINNRFNWILMENFTGLERELISQQPDHVQPLFSCIVWTLKESLSKALRIGFTQSMDNLEIKGIFEMEHGFRSLFTHFSQFQALSFQMQDYVFSITYPKTSVIEIDLPQIRHDLELFLLIGSQNSI